MSGKVRALNQVLGPSGDDVNAPSFTWWSNSNTGIFQPGDNQIGLCTDGSEKVRLLNNGYVGIGTSSPDQMLHVASNAKIDGRMNVGEEGRLLLAASSSDNERGRISFNDDDENWKIYMARNAGVEGEFDSWAVRIRTSDNGGSGVVFENDSDQVTFSVRASDGNTYVRGDLNVDGDVNHEGDLNVEGNLNVEKDVFVAQGRHLNVWDSEGRRIEIGPGVNRSTGASIRTTDNVSTGETMFTVESSGGRNRFGVTHEYGTFARDALRVGYVFDDDSNLPSLSYTLDVNGDARVTSDIVTERDLEVLGTSTFRNDAYFHSGIDRIYSTNYKIYRIEDHPDAPSSPLISSRFSLGITGANGVGLFSGTDNNGWGECVMFADDDGVRMLGKLGVNHASPTYDIEVLKDGSEENAVIRCQADHYAGLILDGDIQDTSGEPGGAYVHFGVDARIRSLLSQVQSPDQRGDGESYSGTTTNSMLLGTLQSNSLHFGTNESVRMTITGSGDVGIGTNSPSRKLDVSGNGRINGDLDVSSDLEVSGISTFGDDAHFHTGIDRIATNNYKIFRLRDHPDAPSSSLFSSSTSLGISGANGVGLFSGTENNGWGECAMFADGDGVRMLGKMGVNNASPDYTLDVGGSGRIDGDLHVDKGIHTLTGASPHGSNSVTTPGVRMMGVSAQDDETDMVWLMCRNRQGENEVMGDLMGSRSSSYFQFSKVSIYVSTAEDNSTKRGFIKTSQGLHDNERWKLITCEYDGDSYIALRYSGHDYPFSFLYFIGVVDTEGPEEAFKSLRTSDVSNISDFSNADTRETVQVEKMGINTDEPEHTLDVQGDIYASGEITSQSDARIKTDVTPIVDALAKVRALRGCVYSRADWETKGVAKDARYIGLIAQEVMPVVPEVVSVSESGTYSLNYMQLVALLVEGLKTLSDQNDGLAEDVRSLSTRLSRLEESRT